MACYREANARTMAANMARTSIETPTEKRCGRCGKVKPVSAFYADKRRRDGLYANCNLCHRILTDGVKAKRPDLQRQYRKTSYDRNAEARRKESREYRLSTHREVQGLQRGVQAPQPCPLHRP